MVTREQNILNRTIFIWAVFLISIIPLLVPPIVRGQEGKFPSKPIEVIVPYAPGGIVDLGTRVFAESLSLELKVPVVIRNQAGGGGLTAPTTFLNTKPDGYTILAGSTGAVITTVLLSKTPPFDPRKDLLPVGYVADSPLAMSVPKTSPFKSFNDFLQYAKSHAGKLKGGFTSLGSENHIMFMSIIRETKIETKMIPYTGTGQLITAILGEHVDWMTLTLPATLPYAKSGDVKVLLLTKKSPELPGIPAGSEIGLLSFSSTIWIGIFVLPNTPKATYDRLVSAVRAASKAPDMAQKLANAGFNVAYKDPHEFSIFINEQWENSSRIIKETGIKVN